MLLDYDNSITTLLLRYDCLYCYERPVLNNPSLLWYTSIFVAVKSVALTGNGIWTRAAEEVQSIKWFLSSYSIGYLET